MIGADTPFYAARIVRRGGVRTVLNVNVDGLEKSKRRRHNLCEGVLI